MINNLSDEAAYSEMPGRDMKNALEALGIPLFKNVEEVRDALLGQVTVEDERKHFKGMLAAVKHLISYGCTPEKLSHLHMQIESRLKKLDRP